MIGTEATDVHDFLKSQIPAVIVLAGGIAWAMTNFVPASVFDDHLSAEERRYVLQLKAEIRDIDKDIDANPDDQGLQDDRAELLDQLCELRPSDRLCR